MGPKVEEELFWRPTTAIEVEEICKHLNPGKSAGWDGVSPRVIKAVASEIAGPLSQLFNYCMREGHYSGSFKVARVVPVFKAEDPTKFSNYRPVSVLPTLSQIFERVLKSRLLYPVLAVHRDCLFDIGAWKQKHKSNAIRIKGPPSGRVMGQSR